MPQTYQRSMFLLFEYNNFFQTRNQYWAASPQFFTYCTLLKHRFFVSTASLQFAIIDKVRKSAISFIKPPAIFEPSAKLSYRYW
jgi:hypothetical protein